MTYRRHLMLFATTALIAAHAYAEPIFMLQFGSFESQKEAEEKLGALKTKHAGVLSRMDTGVREVTLPPDSLKVYRTQAGPLATRADAQSVCSQMASNGDECYVVETAIVQPSLPPSQQTAAAPAPAEAPAVTPPPVEPTPAAKTAAVTPEAPGAPVANAKGDTSTLLTPAPQPTVQAAPTVQAPAVQPPIVQAGPMPSSTQSMASGRDPSMVAAMNRVTANPSVTMAPMNPDATAAMDRELAEAAEKQNEARALSQPSPFAATSVGTSPATTATEIEEQQTAAVNAGTEQPAPKKKSRSIWDRWFGDDEEEAAPKPVDPSLAEAAPIEPVTATPMEAPAPMAMAAAPTAAPVVVPPPVEAAPNQSLPWNTTAVPPQPVTSPQPVVVAQPEPRIITDAPSYPLPAPPAPLKAQTRSQLETGAMTVAPPMPVTAQPNMPMTTAPTPVMKPATLGTLQPVQNPNVRVEEAKRVPLTQATVPPTASAIYYPPTMPTILPPTMRPSATDGMKTLWAEMGPFANMQAALAYWDNYRRQHPDFPVVRVRVTSPLVQVARGSSKVNLRVGPFEQQGFISNLCASTMAPNPPVQNYRCGSVTDLGVTADMRTKKTGFLSDSRYRR